MRILFLLSSLEPAGSETSCLSLARTWGARHEVFWISDRLHYGQSYLSLPISHKAIPGGLINTWKVARFVRGHGIQVIHSHSRRARWIASQVAALTKIPHVATIHQPPPVHLFSRCFPCLGDYTLAIDEEIVSHLQKHFPRALKRLGLIRNGIETDLFRPASTVPDAASPQGNRILCIGRLTGGRRRALQFFFSVLKRSAATLPPARYQIVGRIPEGREHEFNEEIIAVNRAIQPSTIEVVGFAPDLLPLLRGCRGVIAGGRSAMEAMSCGKPVIALGEQGVVGLCTPETLSEAMRTNFGDHYGAQGDHFYPAKLIWSLRQVLGEKADLADLEPWGRAQIEINYNAKRIAADVEKVYEDVFAQVSTKH